MMHQQQAPLSMLTSALPLAYHYVIEYTPAYKTVHPTINSRHWHGVNPEFVLSNDPSFPVDICAALYDKESAQEKLYVAMGVSATGGAKGGAYDKGQCGSRVGGTA